MDAGEAIVRRDAGVHRADRVVLFLNLSGEAAALGLPEAGVAALLHPQAHAVDIVHRFAGQEAGQKAGQARRFLAVVDRAGRRAVSAAREAVTRDAGGEGVAAIYKKQID